ncbi:hypothetical protein LEP1GSC050_4111 [Leptospira broomii serovar Hurstbridge str. 5399]|uniref:Uncharacterized protein n=1 Tax=Leptospira broomii serovar Hurstbridge str. 5399 TaxID=1049789 RepID=T0F8N1_9LEPT|nr:hypothetical protein LEP1GSC050_4111 [Leptospira broomii serovar Hurstbridge str. 5399]
MLWISVQIKTRLFEPLAFYKIMFQSRPRFALLYKAMGVCLFREGFESEDQA